MKRLLLVVMLSSLVATTACSSALTQGEWASDESHAFQLESAQIIDKIGGITAPEGKVFLIIKYQIQNRQSQSDPHRQWVDQIEIEANNKVYEHTFIETLDHQLWAASLAPGEKQSGYIAYTVPEEIQDFKLTFTFPASGTEATYEFRAVDKRIRVNVDYVLTRLEQIERTKRIPLIGELLASFSSSPIRYLGRILVPEEEVAELLSKVQGLSQDAKRAVIEDYLLAHGHGTLE